MAGLLLIQFRVKETGRLGGSLQIKRAVDKSRSVNLEMEF